MHAGRTVVQRESYQREVQRERVAWLFQNEYHGCERQWCPELVCWSYAPRAALVQTRNNLEALTLAFPFFSKSIPHQSGF
jgi:hypothetical protein